MNDLTSHAARGSLGGRKAAEAMTPEQRSERARLASRSAAVSTIEKHWDYMPMPMRDRVVVRIPTAHLINELARRTDLGEHGNAGYLSTLESEVRRQQREKR